MNDLRREILSQVAAGTISAAEGAARLESLESPPVPTEAPAALPGSPAQLPSTGPAGRNVRVVSQFGSAEIVGDPSVAFAIADGPHRARQEGDMMVIEHQPLDDANSFAFGGRRVVVNGTEFRGRKLTVRMNPDLALFAQVQAGNVKVDGVHGPISSEVQAGNCKIDDFRGTLNLVVMAGNVTATGKLDHGASKVRCEAGSVKVNLERGSSVRISARTTLGKVAVEGPGTDSATVQGNDVTIGSGAGTLEVDCTGGYVKVAVD